MSYLLSLDFVLVLIDFFLKYFLASLGFNFCFILFNLTFILIF